MLTMRYWLALQAEALHLADPTAEAVEAMKEVAGTDREDASIRQRPLSG